MKTNNAESAAPVDSLVRLLAFRELALRFLDGIVPQPYHAIVIADAIVSFDGIVECDSSVPLRHHAHEFVKEAVSVIESKATFLSGRQFGEWMVVWNDEFGVK